MQTAHATVDRSGEELIAAYQRTGDQRLREQAIVLYMPLARRLAERYRRHADAPEDLRQVAYLGLVKAVDRFDPRRGPRFTSFAVPTISGELRRYFRATAWNLHVPRGTQENALAVKVAKERLLNRLGRAPSVPELCAATGLDAEAILDVALARHVQATASLERTRRPAGRGVDANGSMSLGELIGGSDERLQQAEHQATLGPLVRALPPRLRELLFLRFACDMTQSEIAARMGCSQMQVSRLLRQTIARLARESSTPPTRPAS